MSLARRLPVFAVKGVMMWRYLAAIIIVFSFFWLGYAASHDAPKEKASNKTEEQAMNGYITDTRCGCKAATRDHYTCAYGCVEKEKVAKYAFCESATKLYVVEPQEMAAAYVGYRLKVKGRIRGDTIRLTSIDLTESDVYARTTVGWITDTHCGAAGANESHENCARMCVKEGRAEYALYIPSDKKIYALDPQDKAAEYVARQVKVAGIVDGIRIRSISIELLR